MSGKFMNVKRFVIPTLTMVIIASQLMGCAAVSQSELMTMLNTGQQIEIEIATPISEEKGTEKPIDWIQLDQLKTYADFRSQIDDIMKITTFGQGSKNGIAYVNLENQQDGNNTLYNAFMNRKFITNFYENDTANLQIQQIINSVYVDVEQSDAMTATLNAYWNLLPDAEPNYFNGDSTLSRLEAMSLIARASTPVTDEIGNQSFTNAVGQSDFTDLASLVADDSYLSLDDKSLNTTTAKGTITRGEYIYMLISNVFGTDRINSADTKKASFNDCKNAGDIASKEKISAEDTNKDYYDSYELKFTLNNPDSGCPERMYQALTAAQELGIIGSDTRWDEGLTKSEAIELYIDTLQAYTAENGYPVNALGGQGLDEVIIDTTTTDPNADNDNLGVDGEFGDGEYNELDEKETNIKTATEDVSVDTDETNIDVTADVAEATGAKTVIIDGEVYVDLGGDDDDNYVPPTEDTGSTQNPTTYTNPETGDTTIFTPGSGNDDLGPEFGSNTDAPVGHFIQ